MRQVECDAVVAAAVANASRRRLAARDAPADPSGSPASCDATAAAAWRLALCSNAIASAVAA